MMHEYFEKTIEQVIAMPDEVFLTWCSDYLRLAELEALREEHKRVLKLLQAEWLKDHS